MARNTRRPPGYHDRRGRFIFTPLPAAAFHPRIREPKWQSPRQAPAVGAAAAVAFQNQQTKGNHTMSPMMEEMLVHEVVPRLRSVARTIPKVGHEDDEEIIQDATLMAARMMDSAEKAGHPITAGNASYFAARAARSGRRSYYTGRSDVMSPGCQIDGKARHEWLDEEIEMESGDIGTLHDVIAPHACQGRESDPAEEAARNLDWKSFLSAHPPRHRTAILVLVSGGTMREAGKRCGLKDSAALNLKRRIAADLIAFFGEDVIRRLLDGVKPGWEADLRAAQGRHGCRREGGAELVAPPSGQPRFHEPLHSPKP
jgi:hypothetical protein